MFKQIFSIATAATALFFVSIGDANAQGGMTPVSEPVSMTHQPVDCRWNPQGSAICRGRNFCYRSVYHPKCRLYCENVPYDRICDDRGPGGPGGPGFPRGPRGPRGPQWPRF